MAGIFDNAIQAIQARFGQLQSGSPFQANPLGGANPFSGSPFAGTNAFTGSPFGRVGSPFGNSPFGQGGNPFGQSPFGRAGNPFGAGPFQNVGSPFGSNPFGGGSINPFLGSEDDPLGTGIPGIKKSDNPNAGNTAGASGVNFSGPATSDDNQGLTGQQVDEYIARTRPNSPLKGMGTFLLNEANSRGISLPQLLGIMMLESELGTTGGLNQHYNYGGLTGSNWNGQTGNTTGFARAFATFANREDGLRALMDNLASPLYKGKSLQQQIGLWYLGDANAGLGQTDEKGNASMQQYLNVIANAYQGLGVGQKYNPNTAPTPRAGGGGPKGNWEQVALAFTRQGGGWVDYTNGGIRNTGNPKDGMDCSSFTGYVLGLDRNIWNAQAQADSAARKGSFSNDWNSMTKGAIIFFQGTNPNDPSARPVSHVGIYLGNGKMIHTGTPGRGVEIVDLNTQYWRSKFYGWGHA